MGEKYFSILENNKNRKTFKDESTGKNVMGPMRVYPGGLAITRAFGNPYAKLEKFGGKQNVLIAIPTIKSNKIESNDDFIFIASKY